MLLMNDIAVKLDVLINDLLSFHKVCGDKNQYDILIDEALTDLRKAQYAIKYLASKEQ